MTITLFRSYADDSWTAHHEGSGSDEILDLMGTVDIPTCYRTCADPYKVLNRITRLNPDAYVLFGDESERGLDAAERRLEAGVA